MVVKRKKRIESRYRGRSCIGGLVISSELVRFRRRRRRRCCKIGLVVGVKGERRDVGRRGYG